MNFQVTVLKILISYPDGFAVMADLKLPMDLTGSMRSTPISSGWRIRSWF
ncbi:hypothetical protein N2605_27015 [Bradyrhizobium yuanmingense]|nr:hypothetical protein [Bradyrhizobium sp. CB1024]UWU88676.1 hypothetical protein N2605_27015 [Bradyrhizobium sp. CB1024]